MVGNTIKSKKMPEYISTFLDKGIRLLLQGKGQEFLEEYYSYIEKIYNYQIPLKQIATKGKVKKYMDEYIKDCQTLTKAGTKKSRQAWMELALKDDIKVDLGETLYYINIGKSKSQTDVKRITHFFKNNEGIFSEKIDIKNQLEKEWKVSPNGKLGVGENKISLVEYVSKYHPEVTLEDEIILNCQLLPREAIESGEDYIDETINYNVPKYIEMFNKRITPLLVCFSKDIRNSILIENPSERHYFTEDECIMVSGEPNKEGDQDTYEQLMTMEDKEIKFWSKHPEWNIPFLKECGMDWDVIYNEYLERMEKEKQLGIDTVREQFFKIIDGLTSEEIEDFEDGELPASLSKIVDIDPLTSNFVSKEYPDIIIGTIYDVLERNGDRFTNNAIVSVSE